MDGCARQTESSPNRRIWRVRYFWRITDFLHVQLPEEQPNELNVNLAGLPSFQTVSKKQKTKTHGHMFHFSTAGDLFGLL